jgi:hypothetical protein
VLADGSEADNSKGSYRQLEGISALGHNRS